MSYIKASEVHSPRRHWILLQVLYDGGPASYSIAIGRWDNRPALVIRWNGTEADPLGSPQSRGLPVWFRVPVQFWKVMVKESPAISSNSDLAATFLEMAQ